MTTLTYDTFGKVLRTPESRITWLHDFHRQDIVAFISRVTGGLLSKEDLEDVYQDCVHDFYAVSRRRDLQAEQCMPVLHCIAYRRGIDALRRQRHRSWTNADQLLACFNDSASSSQIGKALFDSMGPGERREFQQILRRLLEELPPRQQLVARVYFEHYEAFGPRDTFQRLSRLVSAVTRKRENVETIKSLWHAARATLKAGLERLGY